MKKMNRALNRNQRMAFSVERTGNSVDGQSLFVFPIRYTLYAIRYTLGMLHAIFPIRSTLSAPRYLSYPLNAPRSTLSFLYAQRYPLYASRGQSLLEYVLLLTCIVGALVGMFSILRASLFHHIKSGADGLGQGFLYQIGGAP